MPYVVCVFMVVFCLCVVILYHHHCFLFLLHHWCLSKDTLHLSVEVVCLFVVVSPLFEDISL